MKFLGSNNSLNKQNKQTLSFGFNNVSQLNSNVPIFYNNMNNSEIILRVLHLIKFDKSDIDKCYPYRLVIYNDREYLVKIIGYDEYNESHDYSDRLMKRGRYLFEMNDSYNTHEIFRYIDIKNLISNRITIKYEPSWYDKLFNKFSGYISVGWFRTEYYSIDWSEIS